MIGDLLEEIVAAQLETFCAQRGLYLDKKGVRGRARTGKKVSWQDKFDNAHDLDFVIEKGGDADQRGRPLAFIEAAWRRYTKHSRNKAQEIQGAILPVAEKYTWDQPFLGAVLAGVFTEGSLVQMRSSGFEVTLLPYNVMVDAFSCVGVSLAFDENTPDAEFSKIIAKIKKLSAAKNTLLRARLVADNRMVLDTFFAGLDKVLMRKIDTVMCIPLHGRSNEFSSIHAAIDFIRGYDTAALNTVGFRKFEVIVRYNNLDKIDASFENADKALEFLHYISGA